jgi:hypothetical protein
MHPAGNDADATRKDDVAVGHGESSSGCGRATGEGDRPGNRRPEPRVDADDRTPEEAGYGHGV